MSIWSRFARRTAVGVLAFWLGGMLPAGAVELMDGKLQLHGFITQGMVSTSHNNFLGGSEDNGSLDFREMGVNLSLRATPDIQVSGQLLSHRTGDLDEGDVRLDYGLVDWTAFAGERGKGGVRVGRVKHPFGLYNETRDVAFTRPGIILPQSIYFEQARNLEMSSDGVEFYYEHYGDMGNLFVTYGAGYGQVGEKSVEAAFLGRDFAGRFDSHLLHLLNVTYEGDGGRYRVGLTSVWAGMDYKPEAGSPLAAGTVDFRPIVLSGQYNGENWSVTSEYFLEYIKYRDLGPARPDSSPVAQSYYLQGTYRPAAGWETFLRYDVFYADRSDRSGEKFHAATGLPGFMTYAKDWTAGVRYDVTQSFMVRAEWHHIHGTGWLSSLENPNPMALDKRWDMFMLLGSFRF